MIDEIVKGISRAIFEAFGEEYTIYKDDVQQHLNEPCFYILHLRGTSDQKSPTRYFRHHLFNIHYFPKSDTHTKSEMRSVGDKLFLSLEYINVLDNLCRGTKMSYEIIDDVLHFFVSYDMFVIKEVTKESDMTTLEHQSTLEVNNGR